MKQCFYQKRWLFIGGCLIGILCFLLTYGYQVLNVTYDAWLFHGDMDLTQHYLGWCHYRTSPWQFPVGLIDSLSYPISVSVLWTDSIPLFAIIGKLFSGVLPKVFQYFGWFALLSFMLQGGLSVLLLARWTKNRLVCFAGALFFVLSFPMLQRTFYHTSLGAQWILLLALYLQLEQHKLTSTWKKCLAWSGMAFLCVWIHSYFLPMVAIFMAGAITEEMLKTRKWKNALGIFFSYGMSAFVNLYVLGAFYEGASASGPGLGTFSSNLNTLFNSQGHSAFLKGLPLYFDFQYEGFGYLGLGMLILLAVVILMFIYQLFQKKIVLSKNYFAKHMRASILFIQIIMFLALAVFPIITINQIEIIHIPYPGFVEKILSIFRSNGRFIWGAVYLVMIGVLVSFIKFTKEHIYIIFICACAGMQLLDLSDYMNEKREHFQRGDYVYETLWDDSALNNALQNYKDFVFMYNENDIIMPTAYYAYLHSMRQNNYYYARSYDEEIEANMDHYQEELKKGKVREGVIYIFKEEQKNELENYPLNYEVVSGHIIGTKEPLLK